MKVKFNKYSQAWSIDVMLAIVIFITTIFLFFVFLNPTQKSDVGELRDEASIVLKDIESAGSDLGIVDGAIINETKLQELLGKDYQEIKKSLRIKNDFCIYFEDENGNIIYIEQNRPGVGSGTINISNVPCS